MDVYNNMSNQSVIQLRNRKQFVITLPKTLVLAKCWKKADELEFVLDDSGSLIIKKAAKGALSNKSILQFPNDKQFILTLPKDLVLAKCWKKGDRLEFVFNNHADIVIKKVGEKNGNR